MMNHDTLKKEIHKKIPSELKDSQLSSLITSIIVDLVDDKIDASIALTIESMVRESFLQNLIQDKLFSSMQDMLEKEVKARASGLVTRTDLGTVISDKIAEFIDDRMSNSNLPDSLIPLKAVNISSLTLSADKITKGTIKKFTSTGIEDTANAIQLTVMDDMIVVEGCTITNELAVEKSARIRKLEVQDELRIKGDLVFENDNFSKQVEKLVANKIADDKMNNPMDMMGRAILNNGKEIISESSLGASIAFSNLRKVGNLQDLNVIGKITASGTIAASDGRVGINTEDPAGALTIWDEESELTIKKYRNKTMYIGSTRDCDLVFGSQDKVVMAIRKDGAVQMNNIEMNGLKISISAEIPSHQGTPGEIVIMSRPVQGQPWAYQCLEGKKWTAMNR